MGIGSGIGGPPGPVSTAVQGSLGGLRGLRGLAGRLWLPGVGGAAAALGTVLVAVVDPERPGHYPVCPTLALTGFYCPACGGLRAVHALAHGDLGVALHRNPVVVLGLPFVAWAYLAWLRRRVLDRPVAWLLPPWLFVAVAGLFVGFTVLRNLPGFAWLAP